GVVTSRSWTSPEVPGRARSRSLTIAGTTSQEDLMSSSPQHPEGPAPENPEPAAPLNRAERRAQRRGRKAVPPPGNGPAPHAGPPAQVVVPRRAGRRGNR